LVGIVAILAVVLHEYLGGFWVLVLTVCIVAFLAGLFFRKSRWLPLLTFATGCVLSGLVVGGVVSENCARQIEGIEIEHCSTPVALPTYTSMPIYTPSLIHTPFPTPTTKPGESRIVLPETQIKIGEAFTFAGKVTITCKHIDPSRNSARIDLYPIGGSWKEFTTYVGRNEYFQAFGEDYYLTILMVEENSIKVTITHVPP